MYEIKTKLELEMLLNSVMMSGRSSLDDHKLLYTWCRRHNVNVLKMLHLQCFDTFEEAIKICLTHYSREEDSWDLLKQLRNSYNEIEQKTADCKFIVGYFKATVAKSGAEALDKLFDANRTRDVIRRNLLTELEQVIEKMEKNRGEFRW